MAYSAAANAAARSRVDGWATCSTTFAFYLFGAAFNQLFLVYAALVPLSVLALIFGLVGSDVTALSRTFRGRLPAKWISGFMLLVAAGLSATYAAQSLAFITTGNCHPWW